jgi:hypothetical protein
VTGDESEKVLFFGSKDALIGRSNAITITARFDLPVIERYREWSREQAQ